MKRRDAMRLLGLALALAACGSIAQPARKSARVGVLVLSAENAAFAAPLAKRLAELGWVEGRNLVLEVRHAGNRLENLSALVAELVRLDVDVIVTASTPVTRAAKEGAAGIPIVFTWVADPVGSGMVASLPRPGGNLTGLSNQSLVLGPKQLELLQELVPGLRRVAELRNPAFEQAGSGLAQQQFRQAAARAGVNVFPVDAKSAEELEGAFAEAAREKIATMVVPPIPLYAEHRRRIAELALKYRLATAFQARPFVAAGGLVSYGSDLGDGFVRTAAFVDKILRGAKAADIPVEQMDRFETVVNMKTARELGIKMPASILARATEIIE